MFHKIKGGFEIPEELGAEGDVLSHLGTRLSFTNRVYCSRIYSGISRPVISQRRPSNQGLPTAEPVSSWCGLSPALQCICLIPERSSEAVNPVAMGKTRAKQYSLLKTSPDDCKLGDKAMCVQIHGDASFAGQGVVMESLGLSKLCVRQDMIKCHD
jgi:probable 2-oxoglutarate dehydrogenase E1 component DHKTD1